MHARTKRRKRPTFRWGKDVEQYLEAGGLSGAKTETLRRCCELLIGLIDFLRRHPGALIRFRGAPDLNDPAVTLSRLDMFDRAFTLDYREADRSYELNFARDPTPRSHGKGRSAASGRGAVNNADAASPANVRPAPKQKTAAERIALRVRVWRRRAGSMPSKLALRLRQTKLAGDVMWRTLRQSMVTFVHRLPRIGVNIANVRTLLTDVNEPAYNTYNTTWRLAKKAYDVGGGFQLLLQGFERTEPDELWEPSLFGALPGESEQMT